MYEAESLINLRQLNFDSVNLAHGFGGVHAMDAHTTNKHHVAADDGLYNNWCL